VTPKRMEEHEIAQAVAARGGRKLVRIICWCGRSSGWVIDVGPPYGAMLVQDERVRPELDPAALALKRKGWTVEEIEAEAHGSKFGGPDVTRERHGPEFLEWGVRAEHPPHQWGDLYVGCLRHHGSSTEEIGEVFTLKIAEARRTMRLTKVMVPRPT
jgi:hypothetical protein